MSSGVSHSGAMPPSWPLRGLFAIALLALVHYAQPLLAPVAVAIVLTFVLAGPVRSLRKRGVPESVGAALVVATLIGGAALLGSAMSGPATQWWERAPTTLGQLTAQFDRLRASVPLLAPRIDPAAAAAAAARSRGRTASTAVASTPDPIKERIASEGVALTGAVLKHSVTFSVAAVATVILLYFLLASEHWLLSRTVEAIPRRRTRALVLAAVRNAQRQISHLLGVTALINGCIGLLTAAAVAAMGLPNPLLWGSVAALLNFIPYFGPLTVTVLLLLAGIVTFDAAPLMVAPAASFLMIHAIEANFVTPWLVGRRLLLSPLSVFLSVMFWGWLWGIAGALIAVPMLICLRNGCKYNRRLRLLCAYLEGGRTEPPTLRALLRPRRRGVASAVAGASAPKPAPAMKAADAKAAAPRSPAAATAHKAATHAASPRARGRASGGIKPA